MVGGEQGEERDHFKFDEMNLDESIRLRHGDSSFCLERALPPKEHVTFQVIPEAAEAEASFDFDDDNEKTRPRGAEPDDDAYGLDAVGADMTFDTRPAQVSSKNFAYKGPQSLTIDTE